MAEINITGLTFSWLKVEGFFGDRNHHGTKLWRCKCACGNLTHLPSGALRFGNTKSCGCKSSELKSDAKIKHGYAQFGWSAEYQSWRNMKERCLNPKNPRYEDYGLRGVTVCELWKHSFTSFLNDMGLKPSPALSLERVNNNGNYEPGNCVWGTRIQQGNNKRNNVILEFNGRRQTVSQWGFEIGIKASLISCRIKRGWSVGRALTTVITS